MLIRTNGSRFEMQTTRRSLYLYASLVRVGMFAEILDHRHPRAPFFDRYRDGGAQVVRIGALEIRLDSPFNAERA